jgi:hypothetical protein
MSMLHAKPRIRLLAAALSLALPAYAENSPHPNSNNKPQYQPTLDFSRLRNAFAAYASHKPISHAPQRAPRTQAITSTADMGSGSLREALANAVDGDVIDLSSLHGTIALSSALEATANVTINGPGEHLLVLDGGGRDRVLQSAHDLRVSNVTIANGAASPFVPPIGGCIYVNGNLYLQHTTVTGCTAAGPNYSYGGAIAALGQIGIKYSTVSNSSASGANAAGGGGVASIAGVALIFSTVSGNSVTQTGGTTTSNLAVGGGIISGTGSPSYIIYSTISGNSVSASGGSYYNPTTMTTTPEYGRGLGGGLWGYGGFLLGGSTVTGNSVTANGQAYGGGAYAKDISAVYASVVSNNSAQSSTYWAYGGGIMTTAALTTGAAVFTGNQVSATCATCFIAGGALFSKAPLNVQASTFSANSVTATGGVHGAGGAIAAGYGLTSTAILTNSTVTGNSVTLDPSSGGNGGGIWIGGPLSMNNSTVAFNTSSSKGGGITAYAGATNTLYSSIVASNTAASDATTNDVFSFAATTISGSHSLVMAAGANVTLPGDNISGDPLLQPLAFNGGQTKTLALDPASPAIDTGLSPVSLTTDQRGFTRVVGAAADIGAYELDTDRIFTDGFNYPLLQ